MSADAILDLWRDALTVTVAVCAPFLVATLAVGLAVAVVQTATQLQENVLTFVPKLAAALLVIALAGHWALDKLGTFTARAFTAHTEAQRSTGPAGDAVATPSALPGP